MKHVEAGVISHESKENYSVNYNLKLSPLLLTFTTPFRFSFYYPCNGLKKYRNSRSKIADGLLAQKRSGLL